MKVSPNTYPESALTGSTLADLVKKTKELGRTHFAYTDRGHLSSCLKAYGASKKAGLKFIPGIEIFFKDSSCPIISGTTADRCKYFNLSIYCLDQNSYQELSKIVSRTNFPTIEVYEDRQNLWNWELLKEVSKLNTVISIGGIHCLVGKTFLSSDQQLAEKVYVKLVDIFPNRIYASLLCEPWAKRFTSVIAVEFSDGTKKSILSTDLVTTDRARRMKASDLIDREGHKLLKSVVCNGTFEEIEKEIKAVTLHKGFLPLPGGDVSKRINQFFLELSKRYSLPILVSDFAYYANKEDKVVQNMKLEGKNKLQPSLYMKSEQEVLDYLTGVLGLSLDRAKEIIGNNEAWAKLFDNFKFTYNWRLADTGEKPMLKAMEIIKKNGRMKWDNPVWVARLREELEVIAKNPKKDLTGYFLPIIDVINFYKENKQLVGPLRGSCGGSLFCYLLGITQIDPIKWNLPFSRFFSLDRIMNDKLPDIDQDLPSRDLLVGSDGKSGFLFGKWGDKAAQISTRTTIRLKSAIKDANRYFNGKVEEEIEKLSEGLPPPPQGVSDHDFVFGLEDTDGNHIPGLIEQSEDLKRYVEKRPKEWDIVSKAMGLTRSMSRHASAYALSDVPIKDLVPTKEGYITQYEAKEVETAGLIKYDFLVIHQLQDIQLCLELINKKHKDDMEAGYFKHNGVPTYIWDLPEETGVFKDVWGGNTETIFQINTKSMIPFVKDICPSSVMDLAIILALVRPGPLDFVDPETGRTMAAEYCLRRKGMGSSDIPEMQALLPETHAIIVFQEQLVKIARELGNFNSEEAEKFRENAAKKKKTELMRMKPLFVENASKKIDKEVAEKIWDRMETFARYSFNLSHSVGYSHITHACMFLKHFYPLEWWASILTNATEQEITGKFWPYVKEMVLPPDINLSSDNMVVDYQNNKIRSKLGIIRGLGEATIKPIVDSRPYKDIQDFVDKEVSGVSLAHKLIHVGVLDSLFPQNANLLEKLKMYEDSVEVKKFNDKKKQAEASGKKMRALQPKEGSIPEAYLNLSPLKDVAMKKAVLPSLPIDLHGVGKLYSKVIGTYSVKPIVIAPNGYDTLLIDGKNIEILDNLPGSNIRKDLYVASTCYVIEAKEFAYPKKNPTKKALKLILDCDNYISEKVLWPDYNSGELIYPSDLKKGSIVTAFFRKKANKDGMMNITSLVVET